LSGTSTSLLRKFANYGQKSFILLGSGGRKWQLILPGWTKWLKLLVTDSLTCFTPTISDKGKPFFNLIKGVSRHLKYQFICTKQNGLSYCQKKVKIMIRIFSTGEKEI
jgi:hypothetical protein